MGQACQAGARRARVYPRSGVDRQPASAPTSLLEGLNEPQREAVTHGEGPLLILAGAGSGKTRALTRRIAYLVGTGAAQPSEILAITFTNKAATEMRERVEQLVGARARAMWVMTFHSSCARMLRSDAERLGYTRGFTIYDEADSVRLVKRCIEELGVDPKRFPPRGIKRQISDAKNQLLDAEAYRLKVDSYFEQTAAEVYELYEQRIHSMNAMDFDDLLFRCVNLFELFPEVLDRYRRSFQHVLVDEYQDTNHAQYRWLRLLAEEHRNLAVVGDDAQSIYAFRGADIRNVLGLRGRLPRRHHHQARAELPLDADDPRRRQRDHRQQPQPEAQAPLDRARARASPIHLRELEDEHAEARFVAGEIERHVDGGGSRDDVAVFYRANAQSRVLEDTLVRYGVGYQVIGGTRFYERAEIKDALAYLTLLVNPHDVVSFGRIVNSPRRGIGDTSQARIDARTRTRSASRSSTSRCTPEDVPGPGRRGGEGGGPLHGHDGEAARRRGGLVGGRPAPGDPRTTPATSTRWRPSARSSRRAGWRTSRSWWAWRASTTPPPRSRRWRSSSSRSRSSPSRTTCSDDEGIVTLMTLHNAKGLEYDVVFMIGCEDGVFPHSRSIEAGDIEEERRLCYVGVTRARTRALRDPRAHSGAVRRPRVERAQPLPRRDPRRAHRRRRAARPPGRCAGTWCEPAGGGGARAASGARARGHVRARRRRDPRQVRRRRGGRDRAGRAGGRALRLRRLRAQADGRLRAAQAA